MSVTLDIMLLVMGSDHVNLMEIGLGVLQSVRKVNLYSIRCNYSNCIDVVLLLV